MTRFSTIFAEVVTLAAGSFAAMTTAVVTLMPNATVETAVGPMPVIIMDDEKMRLVCIIGALGGGVITTLLSSEKEPSARGLIGRVLVSTGCGIIFTPAVFHYVTWVPNTDNILFVSASTAMVAVGVLKTVMPLWQKFIASKLSPPSQ